MMMLVSSLSYGAACKVKDDLKKNEIRGVIKEINPRSYQVNVAAKDLEKAKRIYYGKVN